MQLAVDYDVAFELIVMPLSLNLQFELAKMLLDEGQMHLFEQWPEPGVDDDKKRSFFEQVCLPILTIKCLCSMNKKLRTAITH